MGNEEKGLMVALGYEDKKREWSINTEALMKEYLEPKLDEIKERAKIEPEAVRTDEYPYNRDGIMTFKKEEESHITYYVLDYKNLSSVLTNEEKQELTITVKDRMLKAIKDSLQRNSWVSDSDNYLLTDYGEIWGLTETEINELKKNEGYSATAYFNVLKYTEKEEDKVELMRLAEGRIDKSINERRTEVFNYLDGTYTLTRYHYLTRTIVRYLEAIKDKNKYDFVNRIILSEPKDYFNCKEFKELKDRIVNIKGKVKNEPIFYKELIKEMLGKEIEPKVRDYLFEELKSNKAFNRILLKSLFSGAVESS